MTGTASTSSRFNQMSVNAMGAAVIHSGGVTLGNYLGDTFALVEAKGARNAHVLNSARVPRSTASAMPWCRRLTPITTTGFRWEPAAADSHVEIQDSEKIVAPYAGAMVKVSFRTLRGYPLMFKDPHQSR
ncbi:fimbria/pilus outer membrane usher protein [Pantoea ananatis]